MQPDKAATYFFEKHSGLLVDQKTGFRVIDKGQISRGPAVLIKRKEATGKYS